MRMQRSDVAGLIDHPQCSEGTFVSCTAPSGASTVRFTRPCIACSCLHELLSSEYCICSWCRAAAALLAPGSASLSLVFFLWAFSPTQAAGSHSGSQSSARVCEHMHVRVARVIGHA